MATDIKSHSTIKFHVSEGSLLAQFIPNTLTMPLSSDDILEILEDAGFGNHHLDEECIIELITASTNNHTEVITIAEHHDASFEIAVDAIKLQATLVFQPAIYGNNLSTEAIVNSLIDMGIVEHRIDIAAIETLLSQDIQTTVSVAHGESPIHGIDGSLEVLFDTVTDFAPQPEVNGRVNHYETHQYVMVNENTPLMRRIPPTEGQQGMTIFGEPIPPVPGVDIQFELNETVYRDPMDTNSLLAKHAGHPILKTNSVYIDESLMVDNADLASGNIYFDGSVHIKGDVAPNVTVEASGDIFVKGTVDNARIISGNTVSIQGGVISSKHIHENTNSGAKTINKSPEALGGYIKAESNLFLKYCNTIFAEAGGSIYIEDYSLHSYLRAEETIVLGYNSGKGVLLGGHAYAQQLIQAKTIGSDAYVRTDLHCADRLEIKYQIQTINSHIKRTEAELNLLVSVLEAIKRMGSPATVGKVKLEKAKTVHKQIQVLKAELHKNSLSVEQLSEKLKTNQNPLIDIQQRCYPNTHITIFDISTITKNTHEQCKITSEANKITFN